MKLHRILTLSWILVGTSALADGYTNEEVTVGLLTDLSGIYSDIAGQGAIIAAEMAIEDFGGQINGKPIRLLARDHQSNGEVALKLGKQLKQEHNVDVFAEMVSSGTAIPLQRFARDNGIVTLHSGAASSALTSEECSPIGVHWAYDTVSLARGTVRAIAERGENSWYFVTADYSFGHTLEADAREVLEQLGGTAVGHSLHPFKGTDFTMQLLEAQASGAEVIALANAGGDALNSIRQAYELGVLDASRSVAGLLIFVTDIRRLGLYVASGLKLTTGFYWNMDERTREWSERFRERAGMVPTMIQASVYSSLMHYFKAAEQAGTDEAARVVTTMRAMPVEDFFARNGRIRADGRMVHDMYLFEVKRPSESSGAWDYLKLLEVIPGEQAFRPMEDGNCQYL